jgi:hypothetical protein
MLNVTQTPDGRFEAVIDGIGTVAVALEKTAGGIVASFRREEFTIEVEVPTRCALEFAQRLMDVALPLDQQQAQQTALAREGFAGVTKL